MNRDDERRARGDRRAERRAVQDVEAGGRAPEPERVPERVPPDCREASCSTRVEPDELEAGAPRQLAEQPANVPRRPGARLDERRGVDPDPHAAALRTASRGSG